MGVRRVLVLGMFVVLVGAITVLIPTQTVYAGFPTSVFTIFDDNDGGDCEGEEIGKWDNRTKTCRLTIDLNVGESIVIDDDEITLNCDGHLLEGFGSGVPNMNGITIDGQNFVTIKNCDVTEFANGIFVDPNSDSNTIKGNNAFENMRGIFLDQSDWNEIKDNNVHNNGDGIFLLSNSNNTLADNHADHNGFGIILDDSEYNTLNGNTANENDNLGILLFESNVNRLAGNVANGNVEGIGINRSDFNDLIGNTANGNGFAGIELHFSENNILKDNIANDNDHGIFLGGSNNNTLEENTANENEEDGIKIEVSDFNYLIGNNAFKNLANGFFIHFTSDGNTIEDNEAKNNDGFGFDDDSSGGGTENTANFYTDNKCVANGSDKDDGSDPDGLCSPQN